MTSMTSTLEHLVSSHRNDDRISAASQEHIAIIVDGLGEVFGVDLVTALISLVRCQPRTEFPNLTPSL